MQIMPKIEAFSAKVLSPPLGFIENTKVVRKIEDYLTKETVSSGKKMMKLNVLQKHLPGILGLWTTAFYAQSILKNKDIPKERKTPLSINNLFCGAVGTAAGYYVVAAMKKFTQNFLPKFKEVLKKQKLDAEKIGKLTHAMEHSLIPLLAFSFAFRFLAPVIATPLANKVNNFLIKHDLIKDPKKKPDEKNSDLSKAKLDIKK